MINCLYAPNEDFINEYSKRFFEELFNDSDYHKIEHNLYSGDFNVVLNHKMDTLGYLHINNPYTQQYINSQIAKNELLDIWRERNKGTKAFTFNKHQTKNRTKARLD